MKKSILIFSAALITFSITAFGYQNLSNNGADPAEITSCSTTVFHYDFVKAAVDPALVDFFYDVAPRYMSTFTKTDLGKVRSMVEFDRAQTVDRIVSYRS